MRRSRYQTPSKFPLSASQLLSHHHIMWINNKRVNGQSMPRDFLREAYEPSHPRHTRCVHAGRRPRIDLSLEFRLRDARPLSRLSFLNAKREIAIISIARLLYPHPGRTSYSEVSNKEADESVSRVSHWTGSRPCLRPPLCGLFLCHALISMYSWDTSAPPRLTSLCIIHPSHYIPTPPPLPYINSGA